MRSDVENLEGALGQKRETWKAWCNQLEGLAIDLNRIAGELRKLRTKARSAGPVRPIRRASARRDSNEP